MQLLLALLVVAVVAGYSVLTNGNPIIDQLTEHYDESVWTLYRPVDDQKLEKISRCYEPKLAGQYIDIVKRSTTIKSIVEKYYLALPEKNITQKSVGNLIRSIHLLVDSCLRSDSNATRYASLSDEDNLTPLFRELAKEINLNFTIRTLFSPIYRQKFGQFHLSNLLNLKNKDILNPLTTVKPNDTKYYPKKTITRESAGLKG